MYKKIPGGSCMTVQQLTCWIPPVGFGTHSVTGEIGPVDIIKRSNIAKNQYWEPQTIPDDYEEAADLEAERCKTEPLYVNNILESIRQREWRRRMYGVWVYINGDPVYLPGIFYFFLNYWPLDTGLPDFRRIDLEYFMFWQYCVEDPNCFGLLEVCKRRNGKSYRGACIVYEAVSRTKRALGGIQSKNQGDAQDVFDKAIVPQFQSLPSFFRPIWDDSLGSTPKGKLRFYKTSKKGKEATRNLKSEELKSQLDYRDAKPKAYDGTKTYRLLLDESGKVEHDVIKRHLVLKHCCLDNKRRIVGKMIVTSTVEEIGVRFRFDELWYQSNPAEREVNGQTKSGLYHFFMSAARSGDFDIYGEPQEAETLASIMADRASQKDNPSDLIDLIRKEPLYAEEAFKTANDACHFNLLKLNDRLSGIMPYKDSLTERGNFVWANGERDTKVLWQKDPQGRWEILRSFMLKAEETNLLEKRGTLYFPKNNHRFGSSCDPYDHNMTEDNRRSNGASLVKQISNINNHADPFINAYVVKYLARPLTADILWEDMIKQSVYFGCQILVENNKRGIIRYFEDRGYGPFLQRLPGYKEAGIPATEDNKHTALFFVEEQVENNSDKIFFIDLLNDLIKFDVTKTQKFDIGMACLWVEMACRSRGLRTEGTGLKKITDYFPRFKLKQQLSKIA